MSGRISCYRITRFQFARERPVGDSQVRADTVSVAAIELLDDAGHCGLGFCQTLLTSLPDEDEIVRIFEEEAWPELIGRFPAALALRVSHPRGGNLRRYRGSPMSGWPRCSRCTRI